MKSNQACKIETRLEVKNESEKRAKLYLYGVIRQAYYWESDDTVISSNRVMKALADLEGKDIDVHINSGGGDVFESIAIRNLLKQHEGSIDIYIDSLAGSGASVIATAGENIYMYDNSMQMIHKAWTIVMGNADELRKTATDLDKIDSAVKASYMSKFVGTEDELETLIAQEEYLTAEECIAFGFATKIIEVEKGDSTKNSVQNLFNKYRKSDISIEQNKNINNNEAEKKSAFFNAFKNKMEAK